MDVLIMDCLLVLLAVTTVAFVAVAILSWPGARGCRSSRWVSRVWFEAPRTWSTPN